jgi:nicotinamidase-related amidase
MKNIISIIAITLLSINLFAQTAKSGKSKSVLLITSAQVDLLSENGKAWGFTQASEEKNKVRQNLIKIIEKAHKAGIPIIHSPVGFDYKKMKGFEPLNPIQKVIIENQLLAVKTKGVDFIPEAQPKKNEIVLPYRQGFSSFWAKSIQEHLTTLGVDTIYIAGMLAEGCITSHTRDAAENGYATIVISDAVGSTSLELYDGSFITLGLHAKSIITTSEFLKCK